MNNILLGLINITITMSVIIVILLFARNLMKMRFTATCRFIIWTIVMLRLCVPLGIMMPIINVELERENTSVITEPRPIPDVPETNSESDVVADSNSNDIVEIKPTPETSVNNSIPATPIVTPSTENKSFDAEKLMEYIPTVIFSVWLFGATFSFCYGIIQYAFTVQKLNSSLKFPQSALRELYSAVLADMKIKKAPLLYMSNDVGSPLLYGYVTPKIVLPDVVLETEDIEGILRHELTHYKRGDLFIKLISLLGNSVHWFNPLAYIAAKIHASEMELSCDEAVLRNCDEEKRVSYGNTMLAIVRFTRKSLSPLTTSFNPTKSKLKERFVNILDMTKKRKGIVIISGIAIVCAIAGALFGRYSWVEIPSETVQIYYYGNAEDGKKCKFKLIHNGEKYIFNGFYYKAIENSIKVMEADLNYDSYNELLIEMRSCTYSGANNNSNVLYAIDGKTKRTIKIVDIASNIKQNLTLSSDDSYYYFDLNDVNYRYLKPHNDESYKLLSTADVDTINSFHLSADNKLFCEYTAYVDEDYLLSAGSIVVSLKYEGRAIVPDIMEFQQYDPSSKYMEYKTNDENWRFYFKDSYFVLENIYGKSYKYKENYVFALKYNSMYDVYVEILDDYAVLVYKSLMDGQYLNTYGELAYAIDLKDGKVYTINKASYISQHPKASDYIDQKNGNIYSAVRSITREDDVINIEWQGKTLGEKAEFSGVTYFYCDYNKCSSYIPFNTVVEDQNFSCLDCVENIDDISKLIGVNHYCVFTVEAFLLGNTEKLETLTLTAPGLYDDYAEFEFGDYSISRCESDGLLLRVEITKSNNDILSVGFHEFKFKPDSLQFFEHQKAPLNYDNYSPALEFVKNWLQSTDDVRIYGGNNADKGNNYSNIYAYLSIEYGTEDRETIIDLANKVFGIEDFDIDKAIEDLEEKGTRYSYSPIATSYNENEYTVTIQFYADFAKTIESDRITYTIVKEDDMLIFKSMTVDQSGDIQSACFRYV